MRRRRRSVRQRRAQGRGLWKVTLGLCFVLLVVALGMQPGVRAHVAEGIQSCVAVVQAFASSETAQRELTLGEMDVYALQLGVYDNGERAQGELQRLFDAGMPCIIWQEERMRIVCAATLSREELAYATTHDNETWIIEEQLPEVTVRVNADATRVEAVLALLSMPDDVFFDLQSGAESLEEIVEDVRVNAAEAKNAHPDQHFYTQLAQSLENWSAMMEQAMQTYNADLARQYGAVTMCTLCQALRQELIAQSTASAQRTPSTAADVMPPA